MLKMVLACCKVYISKSKNKSALESIEQAAKLFPGTAVVNKFKDEAYNRVGYTLVSKLRSKPSSDPCPLSSAVFAMVKAAFEAIDLEFHSGTHPLLGVVDHICFHPWLLLLLTRLLGLQNLWLLILAVSFSVEYIFGDKTGTLTRNMMEFYKCSIGGEVYETGITEIEMGGAQRNGLKIEMGGSKSL